MVTVLILLVSLSFTIYTLVKISIPESFYTSVPLNNGDFRLVNQTWSEFTSLVPVWKMNKVPADSTYYKFDFLLSTAGFYLVKTILEGLSGPNSYMAQRYLSTASDKEAGKMGLLWIILLAGR